MVEIKLICLKEMSVREEKNKGERKKKKGRE
jgi:hypothetical protein